MSRTLLALCVVLCVAPAACANESGSPTEGSAPDERPEAVAPLPGAEAFSGELSARLRGALAAKGPGYEPRTHHLREDGSPLYTNRLILESSPYLEQHAHNPVNWYPWGDEAFETARRLGRPVLLSVGYSTCHWCHVMERESFEDEDIARFLNEHYVAIKVDREERPDVDAIYMSAVQALTGRGGWPMNVWLTPDRKPFYGGTYFPARDGDRGVRAGFLTLLARLREAYDAQPERVADTAGQLVDAIRRSLAPVPTDATALPGTNALAAAAGFYRDRFDPVHGGTRGGPKFPSNFPVRLLLREHRRTRDPVMLDMAVKTLEGMAAGGIRDHIGGGFHRYAVDERWLVPHFEKMLYDNARLAVAYLEGYQATGREDFAGVARGILDYVAREMTSPEGAFHSATDADSPTPAGHTEEGRFFTWTPAEIEAVIGRDAARVFDAYYGVTPEGNFEGRNVLHVASTVEEIAGRFDLEPEGVTHTLANARERLYRARLARPAPAKDDKILASSNGLMITAFALGGQVLDDPELVRRAERAADFVLARMREGGRLRRSYKDGRARHDAYLDDYAFVTEGLLQLYEATSDPARLREAVALQRTLDEHYRDDSGGGYFMTGDDHEELLAREKPAYDGAEPSGNSVALMNLVRLHELTGDDRYRAAADAVLRAFAGLLERSPASLSEMLLALDFRLDTAKEIVIVTPNGRGQAEPFLAELRARFVPNRVLVVVSEGDDLDAQAELVPLLEGKVARAGRPTAYVCEQRVCKLPTTDPAVFAEQVVASPARALKP